MPTSPTGDDETECGKRAIHEYPAARCRITNIRMQSLFVIRAESALSLAGGSNCARCKAAVPVGLPPLDIQSIPGTRGIDSGK
jgi:hypothetical protein